MVNKNYLRYILKYLIIKLLKDKHKSSNIKIYGENDFIDFSINFKNRQHKYILKNNVSKKWLNQIKKKYENDTLIIVDMKFIEKKWIDRIENNYLINKFINPIDDLRTVLESDYAGKDTIIF